eukprot:CAMPEP_0116542534 /NCGR_PEP_ID=MMETSP0397-20121206/1068_1 /TAXON_ID=216820 /ORGANISM="Cyclophora tenuis, Strain ECT3854" /LENGTH=125 /DNA_ID=CAMNT_0004066551 /DNA_START=1 /DNA_END=378 /DNA_ORIENTATION=+
MNNCQMRQAARSALKQGLYAGAGAISGGIIGGPVGGLVGGIAGSIVGFVKSDPYDGVLTQLTKLDSNRQATLLKEVGGVLMTVGGATQQQLATPELFREALQQLAQQDSVRNGVWRACMYAVETM